MDTKLQLTRPDAIVVYDCVRSMTGPASYQLLRQQILKKVEEAWPEILEANKPTEPDDVRPITANNREQRALAEGYVELMNRKDESGNFSMNANNFEIIQRACKASKVWNWVQTQIEQTEVPAFEEPLDDEPPISDEEAVSDDAIEEPQPAEEKNNKGKRASRPKK